MEVGRSKTAAGASTPPTTVPTMTPTADNARGVKNTRVTTAAQTHFDSRDRLAGRLDGATVRQVVEDTHTEAVNPGESVPTTPVRSERIQERAESHLWELNQTHLDGFQEGDR